MNRGDLDARTAHVNPLRVSVSATGRPATESHASDHLTYSTRPYLCHPYLSSNRIKTTREHTDMTHRRNGRSSQMSSYTLRNQERCCDCAMTKHKAMNHHRSPGPRLVCPPVTGAFPSTGSQHPSEFLLHNNHQNNC